MKYDVVIIGAGAAGFMCAIEAGKRGRSVLLLDHAKKPAEKIRISGGGRCNFTNTDVSPSDYLSNNPRFCISALSRYTQHDFIALIKKHNIAYHEKTLGQLFCDGSATQIIEMLLEECASAHVAVQLETSISSVSRLKENSFEIQTNKASYSCQSLVIATGGKSIPKMGATAFGYDIANQFGLNIISTDAALVPVIFEGKMLQYVKSLAGLSLDVTVECNEKSFKEGMLFTHRGLSGPAILQISSYWKKGHEIAINLAPKINIFELLSQSPKLKALGVLSKILPKRLAACICESDMYDVKLAELSKKNLRILADSVNSWKITPTGTEGFRTAEVTIGGVDTDALLPKTFESKSAKGLYFIGEVVDVTGHLGGFNFQWAWSSGYVAGQYV
jgi:predicted Rossmann fold flavoprotein